MGEQLSNRRRKEIGKLTRRKYRKRLEQMLVEGVRAVEAAIEAEAPLVEILVTEVARRDERVQRVLERSGVPVHLVTEREIENLSDVETSQGLLAVVRTELFPVERLNEVRTLLVLDGVQDPGNVGTLLRTAAWFGAEAVLGGLGTAGFFNPKVVRAAMGGHWDLHLARTEDLAGVLDGLRRKGFRLYGADLAGTPARAWAPQVPSVLVLGSEAHGLSAAVQSVLDERVFVPGTAARAGTESLNVAVSAGILMYEWLGS